MGTDLNIIRWEGRIDFQVVDWVSDSVAAEFTTLLIST
jgi:hypothetical protein